ncbi:heparinase II/III domain-containing protein [Pseudoduganella chitinolytica]|uniref:Heparinase II/III family protein n=1 Tax=Pseudoduganella chitinolytica TaxID=34070 RepID=A0ABY8BD65_9BURK|nr:heparinase II/III family protein [Pseudoduganella chitinolytica]WEF33760.1 heparinase II/III family protein [Pseudoduganella chitinolytica]
MQRTRIAMLLSLAMSAAHAAPTIVSFDADNLKVVDGQPVKLSWTVSDATVVRLNGQVVTGNSVTVTPLATTGAKLDYRLEASNAFGKSTDVRTIALSRGTVLDRGYIPEAYAADCTPRPDTDYMAAHKFLRVEPRDCTVVRTATPVFTWAQVAPSWRLADMTFTLTGPGGYEYSVTTKEPRLLLPKPLVEAGRYTWKVQERTNAGVVSTSQERTFEFDGAELPNVATGAQVRANILAKPWPRILPRDASGKVMTWAAIDAALKVSDQKESYAAYMAKAAGFATPVDVTEPPTSEKKYNTSVRDTLLRIETLATAGQITGNAAYKQEAINSLLKLAAWRMDAEGTTTEWKQDQWNRDVLRSLSLGLDMLYTQMTAAQRDVIINAINLRLAPLMTKLNDLYTLPYNSHLLTAALYAVEVMMHATGAVGSTQRFEPAGTEGQLLAKTWNTVITTIGTWRGGSDSAFGNSTGYAWMALISYSELLADYQLTAGVDISHIQALDKFGDNFYSTTPRVRSQISAANPFGGTRAPFGDGSEQGGYYYSYAWQSYSLFAHVSQNPVDEWYYRADIDKTRSAPLRIYHYLMTASKARVAPADNPQLPSTYLFEDAGQVAMHTDTVAPLRSSLYFRSSRLGSLNHSHADNNSFIFVSKGRDIFVSGGTYGDFGDTTEQELRRATRFKNALTFDAGEGYTDSGIGQAEPVPDPTVAGNPTFTMVANAKLINYYARPDSNWSIATGDATGAYQGEITPKSHTFKPLLKNAVRTVAYNRADRVALIYDFASSDIKRRWQYNFQTIAKPEVIATEPRRMKVVASDAKVCTYFHGADGAFSQPQDMDTLYPAYFTPGQQYHTDYKTKDRHNQIASLTVLTEDCATNVPVYVTYLSPTKLLVNRGKSWLVFDQRNVQISE